MPLNVSRSFLQNDGYVNKISAHITKKVADKLTGLFNTEKEIYHKYWDDINPFIKFGCLKDEKFYDKIKCQSIIKKRKMSCCSFCYAKSCLFPKSLLLLPVSCVKTIKIEKIYKNYGNCRQVLTTRDWG